MSLQKISVNAIVKIFATKRRWNMVKRTENVVLLKVIGTAELLAALAMFYFYHENVPAVIGGLILLGLSANSFYQAHKCYQRQYSPRKDDNS